MPEIAEVKTDADLLDLYCSHRILRSVRFITDKFNGKCQGMGPFIAALPLRICKVRSRAKKIVFYLETLQSPSQTWHLFVSYGMTGGFTTEPHKHAHLQFDLEPCWLGCNTVYYRDTRRIGSIEATSDPDRALHHLTDMARPVALGWDEPELRVITRDEFAEAITDCGSAYLVSKLMDQRSICSGVGNYLLSETLCVARLDPWIHCDELDADQIQQLWDALHLVISEAYKYGGVSMTDYVHLDGEHGTYQKHLRVYGKENETFEGRPILSAKGPHSRTVWYVDWNLGSD